MDTPSNVPNAELQPDPPRPERRRHRRYVCEGFVEGVVDGAEFLFRGELHDFSTGGCYVRTRARLRARIGQEVQLFFTVGSDQVRCSARIASIDSGRGAGLEFTSMNDRARKSMLALVRRFEAAQAEVDAQAS